LDDAFLARGLQHSLRQRNHEIMTTLRLKQELASFAHTFGSCVLLSLVLGGIGGTIYKVISPEGWIAVAFGRSLSAGAAALGSIALIAGLAWFSRSWGDPQNRTLLTDFLIFGFAAAGLLYLVQLWTKGTL
jgi:hypothetical protein